MFEIIFVIIASVFVPAILPLSYKIVLKLFIDPYFLSFSFSLTSLIIQIWCVSSYFTMRALRRKFKESEIYLVA